MYLFSHLVVEQEHSSLFDACRRQHLANFVSFYFFTLKNILTLILAEELVKISSYFSCKFEVYGGS